MYHLGDSPGDGGDAGGEGGPSQTSAEGNSGCSGSGCSGSGSSNGNSNGSGFEDDGGSATIGADDASTGSGFGSADGGSFTSDDAGTSGLSGPSCAAAPAACTGGAIGYACTSGAPEDDSQVALSCTSGTIQGSAIDYCCFPWPGAGGPCAPFPGFPCDGNSYAYQCVPGTTPPAVDPKLSCGTNFVDSNGNNDFCCTYQ